MWTYAIIGTACGLFVGFAAGFKFASICLKELVDEAKRTGSYNVAHGRIIDAETGPYPYKEAK